MNLIENASKVNVKKEHCEDVCAVISLCLQSSLLLLAEEGESSSYSITQLLLLAQKKVNSICASTNYLYQSLDLPEIQSGALMSDELNTAHRPTIGARIQIARENLDMSKAALANKLDLTPECIADWEDGNCPLEASYAIPLANALKCDLMWLLTGNPVDVKPAPPAPVNVMKGADLANIGVRIESRRNQIMMSVDKLAEEIDTSGAMILEWETGKAIPHSDYIDKIAKALNTTVTWLITGKHITA